MNLLILANIIVQIVTIISSIMIGYSIRGIHTLNKLKKVMNKSKEMQIPKSLEGLTDDQKLEIHEQMMVKTGRYQVVEELLDLKV